MYNMLAIHVLRLSKTYSKQRKKVEIAHLSRKKNKYLRERHIYLDSIRNENAKKMDKYSFPQYIIKISRLF